MGILTNSLGIISEALHSGTDVVAAVTTLYAVLVSSKPPDREHPYGYAKFESLASLIEILLLFSVAGYIFYEGVLRLFFVNAIVEITPFSISIMLVSIAVDFGRSRALSRTSKKYGSQALEADSLHFKADMFTSAIILAGLLVVYFFNTANADAYAAIIASLLMVYTSLGLGRRTLDVLLDRAPRGVYEKIEEAVSNLEGIENLRNIRVRRVGPQSFIDMHIEVPRTYTHDRAHRLATMVEGRVRGVLPNSDVLVHVDAIESAHETIVDRARLIAAETDGITNVHSIFISRIPRGSDSSRVGQLSKDKSLHLYLDIQVRGNPDLEQAHEIADNFEKQVREKVPEIGAITTHLETEVVDIRVVGTEQIVDQSEIEKIRKTAISVDGVSDCREVAIINVGDEKHVTLRIKIGRGKNKAFIPNESNLRGSTISLNDAHKIMSEVEKRILGDTKSSRVVVHAEP